MLNKEYTFYTSMRRLNRDKLEFLRKAVTTNLIYQMAAESKEAGDILGQSQLVYCDRSRGIKVLE